MVPDDFDDLRDVAEDVRDYYAAVAPNVSEWAAALADRIDRDPDGVRWSEVRLLVELRGEHDELMGWWKRTKPATAAAFVFRLLKRIAAK